MCGTCAVLLDFLVAVLSLAKLLVIHQVAERLGGDGHHVGEDEAAVTARCQHKLVVAVVVAYAPHPGTKQTHTHIVVHSELNAKV